MDHREKLIESVRRLAIDRGFPRLITLVMLLISGALAFVCSVVLLHSGLTSMGTRYLLSAATGYVTFLVCMRLWIAVRRSSGTGDIHVDVLDLPGRSAHAPGPSGIFEGGRSGGGGGGAVWGDPRSHSQASIFDADPGDLGPVAVVIALALVVALSGVLALGYVVYIAPALLAELALDAALVAAIYRRLRKNDMRTWYETALRRTWAPGLVVVTAAGLAGWGLQWISPEAVSIGNALPSVLRGGW